MARPRTTARDEVARLQQMLDYVAQHVRAREHSLEDPHAQMIFQRVRESVRELQDEVIHYLPHAAQGARLGTRH